MNESGSDPPDPERPPEPEPLATPLEVPPQLPPELPPEPTEPGGVKPLFRIELTVVSVVLALLCHWRAVSYFTEYTPLDQLQQPVELVVRIAERNLDFADATASVPGIRSWIYRLTRSTKENLVEDAEDMYDNVLRNGRYIPAQDRTRLQAHYAVLLGETGDTNKLASVLRARDPTPLATNFVQALERVYLGVGPSATPLDMPDAILDSLNPGWAQDKLEAKLADVRHEAATAQALQARVRLRGENWERRILACFTLQSSCMLAGLAVLAWAVWRRRIPWRAEKEPSFSPWAIQDAIAVVALAEVAGTILSWMMWASPILLLAQHVYLLLSLAPLVLLTHFCLLTRHGLSWHDLLAPGTSATAPASGEVSVLPALPPAGVRLPLGTVVACALALAAVDIVGWWVIGGGFGALGVTGHWAEGIDEGLVFGNSAVRAASLVNAVVFGPGFEELLYRVLLYGALRMRFRVLPSACFSSFLFAATHLQYSLPGILSVFVFGVACALAYERTRSLAVVVVAHGLTNLLIMGMEVLLMG